MSSTASSNSSNIDEADLLDCIRRLVVDATRSDDENEKDLSRQSSEEELESSQEYQELVNQVEDVLVQFLEDQVQMGHGGETDVDEPEPKFVLPIHQPHAYPCKDTHKALPSAPEDWPQRPVMIRPTPGSSTRIRGIRYACERDYRHFSGFCAGCILPVNTGHEVDGKSLVVDFESTHFVGTLLMRIRDIPAAEKDNHNTHAETSYFDSRKRRFQGIVKGKFKTALPMSECVTGQTFDRRSGKMPAKWVVSTFIKFVSTLAPQLETTIDGDNPRFLVPLAATAHTVQVKPHAHIVNELKDKVDDNLFNYSVYLGSTDVEEEVHEPPGDDETSLMQALPEYTKGSGLSVSSSISSRMKARKKAYNSVSAKKSNGHAFLWTKNTLLNSISIFWCSMNRNLCSTWVDQLEKCPCPP